MILEINGKQVEVEDSFKNLSPEEQDSYVNEISGHMEAGHDSHESLPQHTLAKEEYESGSNPQDIGGQIATAGVGAIAGATAGKKYTEGAAKNAAKDIKDTMQDSISSAKNTKAATIAQANAELQLAKEKAMAASPAAAPSAATPGKASTGATENWARAEHSGEFYGGTDYAEADAAAKEAKAFNKASGDFRVPEGGHTRLALPIDIRAKPVVGEVVEAAPAVNPALERTVAAGAKQRTVDMAKLIEAQQIAAAKNAAEAAQNKIVAKPSRMMGGVGGAEVLGNLEGAYRHGTQGDVASTVANTVGMGGGLAAFSPIKKVRGIGAVVGAVSPFVAEALAKKKPVEGKATGGSVGDGSLLGLLMNDKPKKPVKKAKGGAVKLAGGGAALALDLAKKLAPRFSLEAIKAMPVSSAAKQIPVARAFEKLAKENVDPAIKKQIFEQYLSVNPDMVRKSGATNYDELTHAAYDRLGHETKQQYDAMRNAGINIDFDPTGAKSYKNSQEMLKDALENKHLDVFSGGEPHELLGDSNNLFRATHDFFGHGTTGSSFGPKGEELAYGAHAQMYSPLAQLAAAAETRGQNSVVNYGGLNDELIKKMADARSSGASPEELRALGGQWQYAPQKALILPPEHVDINYSGYAAGGEVTKKALEAAKRIMFTHYSPQANLTKLDPLKYGTGMKGAEAERLAEMPELKPRSYFYHGEKIVPESGVGGNRYSGVSERSYPLTEDPAGFSAEASLNAYDPYLASKGINQFSQKMYYNNLEKKIKDAGFSGYHSDTTGVLFEPTDVTKIID